MKRPSFQFYPADWRKDPALSTCSLAARGLWIELVCVAHESDEYGFLTVNGNPMTEAQIARTVGEIPSVVTKLIKELESSAVFSKREDGAIFSRRMVADERIRNIRSEAGKLGGNPNLIVRSDDNEASNGLVLLKQTNKQRTTPSSSSSSTEQNLSEANASSPEKSSTRTANEFSRFWLTWPKSERKAAKGKCEKKWKDFRLDAIADRIIDHIEDSKVSKKWIDGFEPSPLRYLSERRWEDGEVIAAKYQSNEIAVFERYNTILASNGWPDVSFDLYSFERSAAVRQFISYSEKDNWIDAYFEWMRGNLKAKPGYGFDWVIRKETFLRAKEGNFAALQDAA